MGQEPLQQQELYVLQRQRGIKVSDGLSQHVLCCLVVMYVVEHCWGVELLLTLSFVCFCCMMLCNNPSGNSHGTKATPKDDEVIRDGKKIIKRKDGRTRALTNAEIANLFTDKNKTAVWVKNRYNSKYYTY